MAGFVVLLLAVLSRLVPHMLGVSAWGVTAMGGGLLFFGSRLRKSERWMAVLALPLIAEMDWFLTTRVYGFPFQVAGHVAPWAWYVAVCLLGSALLSRRRTVGRVAGAALVSSTGFFLLSNGMVWLSGTMYPKTAQGLLACYAAGLPFYRNDALSTLVVCGLAFGLPALARQMVEGRAGSGELV